MNIKVKTYNIHKKKEETSSQKIQILSGLLNCFEHNAGWFIYKNIDYPTTMELLKYLSENRKDTIMERNKIASNYFSQFCNSILTEELEYESSTDSLINLIYKMFDIDE